MAMTEEEIELQKVKKSFKGEMKKLRQMKFPEKLQYIFTYYWIPIFITIVAIIGITYTVHSFLTHRDLVLKGVILNDVIFDSKVKQTVSKDLEELLGVDRKKYEVHIEDAVLVGGPTVEDTNGQMKMSVYFMSRDVDFLIMDERAKDYFLGVCAYADLEKTLTNEQLSFFKDRLVTLTSIDTDINDNEISTTANFVIDITGLEICNRLQLNSKTTYLGIAKTTTRLEAIDVLLDYITDLGMAKEEPTSQEN